MSRDDITNQEDAIKIKNQFYIIEMQRDFIIWLCEEQCNSSVSEMEEEFKKFNQTNQTWKRHLE